ncbi:GYF domain-containing protein [Anatilimnocola sp. NA78]|uniref:DUF4339 domain-containing protein n=1 Tax=Anatilimnocola sp. NA78 TaxID=3415683 RepID=UPI003CE5A3EF
MNPEWLCFVNGQEYGPYTWPQLVQMAAAGNVVPSTHVRRNFDSQWYLAEHVPNLFAQTPVVTPQAAAHPPASRPALAPRAASPTASGAMKAIPAGKPVKPASAVQPAVQPAQQIPQGVPRGRVVGTSAAQPPAVAANTWGPVVRTSTSPAVSLAPKAASDEDELIGKKPDNSKNMVLALGGTIIVVAILGIVAVIWKMNQSPAPEPVAAQAVEISTEEADPALSPERDATESTPAATSQVAAKAAKSNAKQTEKAAAPVAAGPSQEASAALVKSVTKWSPLEKFKAIGIKEGLVVDKVSVWLAADASGKRAELIGPAAAAPAPVAEPPVAANTTPAPGQSPEIIAPATTGPTLGDLVPGGVKPGTAATPPEPAKFVFVELQIKNSGTKPRQYAGWNSDANSAVLVDDDGQPLPLTPVSATPATARKSSLELKPGETTPDTLVFAMNEPTDAEFKLVLPQRALSSVSKGNWGIAISAASLAPATQTATAQNSGAGPAALRSSTSIPIPGLQDEPKPAPPPAVVPPAAAPAIAAEPEMKKEPVPDSSGKIPIPGLTDEPAKPSAVPKKPDEVPNLAPPPKN